MNIKLENKRLLACADMIENASCVADIGTDHGMLPIYLVQNTKAKCAVAADINRLPLDSAEKNIALYSLGGKIKTVLSDGLDEISPEGISHIVCAGMGGELIVSILSRHEWVKGCTLILQPMTKAEELHKWLFDNGFFIEEQTAVRDRDFVYTVIKAVYAPEKINYSCDSRYMAVGRLVKDSHDSEEFFNIKAARLRKAAEGMKNARPDESAEKFALADILEKEEHHADGK